MKRWHYLTALTLLTAAAVIALLSAAEQRAGLIRDLEAENAYLQRRLQQSRDQLRTMTERQLELEQQLFNVRQMEQICCSAPSRDGRQLILTTMPVTTPSGYSAIRLERALAGTELSGIGEALVQAEREIGINALVLAAICAHESGWGTSRLAREKNNLAGLGAYDCSPGKAMCFDSREDCVFYLARLIADGGSLEEIGTWYASDPTWAEKVAGCMKAISEERR